MPSFSDSSKSKLSTCHPKLQALFNEVIKYRDCIILCGHRGQAEQIEAYQNGRSKVKWPNSKHNKKPSLAVDVAPYPIDWQDKERFIRFAGFVEGVASQMGIKIKWGGDFSTFFDGPHFQLEES
jgi:peptidoglycan L-alanyl-D-glutamate endopeptidase CwlK